MMDLPLSMSEVRYQSMIYVSLSGVGGLCSTVLSVSAQGVDVNLDIKSRISLLSTMVIVRAPYCIDVEEVSMYHGLP